MSFCGPCAHCTPPCPTRTRFNPGTRDTTGKGAYGKVKRGVHVPTGAPVALKVIPWTLLSRSPKDERNLRREVELLVRAAHPNVIALREAAWSVDYPKKDGTTAGPVAVLVMELANGGEVFRFLFYTKRPFSERIARNLFKQLADGVHHAHAMGVCHRDLKPDNLLFDSDFNLKICDFGMASPLLTETGSPYLRTLTGTPAYKSPQLMEKTAYDGTKADVWSMGVILFIFVMGRQPFGKAVAEDEWYAFIHRGQYELFWRYHMRLLEAGFERPSAEVRELINSMLTVDPDARASTEEVLAHPWLAGEASNHEDLTAEMLRRKAVVDRMLAEETAAKKREKEAARRRASGHDRAASYDPYSVPVERSVSQSVVADLPPKFYESPTTTYVYSNESAVICFETSRRALEAMGAKVTVAPRKLSAAFPVEAVAELTDAPTGGSHGDAAPAAEAGGDDAGGAAVAGDDADEAAFPAPSSAPSASVAVPVTCSVQVFTLPTGAPARYVVALRRQTGNAATFEERVFKRFVVEASNIVTMPEPKRLHPVGEAGDGSGAEGDELI